jgi:hypothetical protein
MSDPSYDQKSLARYLLGLLPEAETERLDELSVANDSFATELDAAENDLVDAYVRGELTGEMLEQFRNRYLASPRRLEKMKFALALQEFSEPEPVPVIEARARESFSSPRGRLAGVFATPAFQWGFSSATLALLLAGAWLVIDNVRLRQRIATSQARQNEQVRREQQLEAEVDGQRNAAKQTEQELAQLRAQQQSHPEQQKPSDGNLIATLFLTPQLRGSEQPPTLKLGPTTKSVAAHLNLEPNDFTAYRVALIDQANNRTLWSSGALKAQAKGDSKVLTLKFPADRLTAQSYTLRVSGIAAAGPAETISDYPFRVMK